MKETTGSQGSRGLGLPGWRPRLLKEARPGPVKLLLLLLAADAAFVVLHVLYKLPELSPALDLSLGRGFSIEQDGGYAEMFQYLKELSIALLLGQIAARRTRLYLVWSLLFLYLLLDDSLMVHERLGGIVSERLDFPPSFGLRVQDFGELIVSALFGVPFLVAIFAAYRLGDRGFRGASRYLLLMLVALASAGVAADMLHQMSDARLVRASLTIVEDGGEHVVMSVIVWFVLSLGLARSRSGAQGPGGHQPPHPTR